MLGRDFSASNKNENLCQKHYALDFAKHFLPMRTGDYNMTADRHLGAAWVDKCRPTVLITETTYATTIRDSKRAREQDFLKKVHECVDKNGKILIPVFALGRAQELCILLESYWDRMNIQVQSYLFLRFGLKMILFTKVQVEKN